MQRIIELDKQIKEEQQQFSKRKPESNLPLQIQSARSNMSQQKRQKSNGSQKVEYKKALEGLFGVKA